jgi:magnesium chelatase family protein
VRVSELTASFSAEPSDAIRARVEAARARQAARFRRSNGTWCNAQMSAREVREYCGLTGDCMELLKSAIHDLRLSARAFERILKVGRTIADLAGSDGIREEDILEAVQYRTLDRQIWGE